MSHEIKGPKPSRMSLVEQIRFHTALRDAETDEEREQLLALRDLHEQQAGIANARLSLVRWRDRLPSSR